MLGRAIASADPFGEEAVRWLDGLHQRPRNDILP